MHACFKLLASCSPSPIGSHSLVLSMTILCMLLAVLPASVVLLTVQALWASWWMMESIRALMPLPGDALRRFSAQNGSLLL